jgi:hypothetical protein
MNNFINIRKLLEIPLSGGARRSCLIKKRRRKSRDTLLSK